MPKPPNQRAFRPPILPDRVRRIDSGGFAFVPNRFLREGFFASLTADERSLYLLLVLAGDRNGISYYHPDSLCALLETPLETFVTARFALIQKDLVAFDGTRYQVLSLPPRPLVWPAKPLQTSEDFERSDRATIRAEILRTLEQEPDER
jgi:hypothetical protein